MPQKKKIDNGSHDVSIIFHKSRHDAAREYEQTTVRQLLQRLTKKIHTKSPLKSIEIGIDQQKNSAGKTTLYSVTLTVDLISGDSFTSHGNSRISKVKGVGLSSAIKKSFTDIETQYQKTKKR